jgi:large subunit ribosomal protein L19
MTHLLIQDIEKAHINKKIPDLRPGCTVKVFQKIKEGAKERVQVFEGLIISINSARGTGKNITVRKIVEGIGVEKIFPINAPSISKIEIVRVGKVRRAKLFYMRDISGKATRLREKIGEKKKLLEAMGLHEAELAQFKAKALAEKEAAELAEKMEAEEQAKAAAEVDAKAAAEAEQAKTEPDTATAVAENNEEKAQE